MDTAIGSAARRELAVVLGLASFGILLVLLVAFAPWYEPVMAGTNGPSVVETIPPRLFAEVPAGATTLAEQR